MGVVDGMVQDQDQLRCRRGNERGVEQEGTVVVELDVVAPPLGAEIVASDKRGGRVQACLDVGGVVVDGGFGSAATDTFDNRKASEHHQRNPQSPFARIFAPVMVVVTVAKACGTVALARAIVAVAVITAMLTVTDAAVAVTVIAAVTARTVAVSSGLCASRPGWVICMNRHVDMSVSGPGPG